MREIKFRAWLNKDKKMVEVYRIDFNYFIIAHEAVRPHEPKGAYNVQSSIIDFKHLMQFTGLYDRNKTPIYEGDVLAIPDTEHESVTDEGQGPDYDVNSIGIVKWIKNGWGLSFLDDCHGDYLEGEMSFDVAIDNAGDEDWEVIGNIYEHGHLLENESKE